MFDIIKELKYKGNIGFYIAWIINFFKKVVEGYWLSDEKYLMKRFKSAQGYDLNLTDPQSLNAKLQWLKLYDRNPLYTTLADKYAARNFIKDKFGEEYLVPLVYATSDPKDIKRENLPDYPVIVKANHDSGNYRIIRDKDKVDWHRLRVDCKWWLSWDYYKNDREYQYKNIPRKIIVEKLLQNKEGKIPNDYKLNYINEKLEFIYVSVDREGGNYRNIYDKNWNPLLFNWANKKKLHRKLRGPEIDAPKNLNLMKEIGMEISKLFPYVRVDFYEVDDKLYIGEITQCHGGGFDKFNPLEVDFEFGDKLGIDKVK